MLSNTGISNELSSEFTIYAKLYRNVTIFYQQKLAMKMYCCVQLKK